MKYINLISGSLMKKMVKPKLIAFDLDYTLWPFWVDTHVVPPFHKDSKGQVLDSHGHKVQYYSDVPKMLADLHAQGYVLAAASRTSETRGANCLLSLFDWDKFITYKEIYPGCKIKHFQRFKENSGLDYKEMLFFDDEHRNIEDLSTIGVCSILVADGMTAEVLKEGLQQFAQNHEQN